MKKMFFTVVLLAVTCATGLAALNDGLVAYYPFNADAGGHWGHTRIARVIRVKQIANPVQAAVA